MIHLAWKGLWGRKAHTALTLFGIAMCTLALTTSNGMLRHMKAERTQDVARLAGRLLLQSPDAGYPPFKNVLRFDSVAEVLARPDVIAAQSTPLLFLVLAPADNPMDVAGVIGLGLWPGHEQAWLGTATVISGRATLVGEEKRGVILGSQAARFYNVSAAGQTITLAGHGQEPWHVVGILQATQKAAVTKLDTVDNIVMMSLADAQMAFGLEGWISALLLTAKEGQADDLAHSLAEGYPALEINTQEDIHRLLLRELELPGKFLGTISWTAFAIAVLIIANLMNIIVREHTQETGLMRAIGQERSVTRSAGYTLTEALLLSLSGGILGIIVAVVTAQLFGWTWILVWREVPHVIGLTVAAGLLAGIYPAYRATRAYPQVLRYDQLQRQMEEVAAEKRAIDLAYHHLVRGREEERERLARELHDQVIQSLVGLKFFLAERGVGSQARLQVELDEVINALRELCGDLRPPALDRLGLVATLRSYVDDLSTRTGLPIELHIEGSEQRLSSEVELSLFRVAQESLINAWKHAQTPKVRVSLRFGEEVVELTISDWGQGFVVPERLGMLAEAGHFGLVGMQERMALVGGALRLTSGPGQGTTIVAWVPLRP